MQQINLLPLLPKKTRQFFNLKFIVVMSGVFFMILLVKSFFSFNQNLLLNNEVKQLRVELAQAQITLQKTLFAYPTINPDDLSGSMSKLMTEVSTKTRLKLALSNPVKFSIYLTALSSAINPGVWLTTFSIQNKGAKIDLRGQASTELLIYDFNQRLRVEPLFRDMDISVLEVSRVQDEKNNLTALNFNLFGKILGT